MAVDLLVRYGVIPEVGRFPCGAEMAANRGDRVVVQTERGPQLGVVLQSLRAASTGAADAGGSAESEEGARVLRLASADDLRQAETLRQEAQSGFSRWQRQFVDWNLQLELLDLEWTLDRGKLVVYVLGGRGPDTTRLALLAAASGQASIEVQPVSTEGLVPLERSGGGCGSGGCGCSH
ncbi:MAG TPA: hypothetical protein DDY91_13055 [Planctomycetaceae bacterium]|nr:hypothetical protein [Planctomycetaceae bacterium]